MLIFKNIKSWVPVMLPTHKGLKPEDKIGTMLSCKVNLQELENGKIEIAAVNPMASLQQQKMKILEQIATEIGDKLKQVIDKL